MKPLDAVILEINGMICILPGAFLKTNEPDVYKNNYNFKVGKSVVLKRGEDVTLISSGVMVYNTLKVAELLEKKGISVFVVNMHTIKPVDKSAILKFKRKSKFIFTIEEHNVIGGLGDTVAEILCEDDEGNVHQPMPVFKRIGIQDNFCYIVGDQQHMRELCGLSVNKIVETVISLLDKHNYIK